MSLRSLFLAVDLEFRKKTLVLNKMVPPCCCNVSYNWTASSILSALTRTKGRKYIFLRIPCRNLSYTVTTIVQGYKDLRIE